MSTIQRLNSFALYSFNRLIVGQSESARFYRPKFARAIFKRPLVVYVKLKKKKKLIDSINKSIMQKVICGPSQKFDEKR